MTQFWKHWDAKGDGFPCLSTMTKVPPYFLPSFETGLDEAMAFVRRGAACTVSGSRKRDCNGDWDCRRAVQRPASAQFRDISKKSSAK